MSINFSICLDSITYGMERGLQIFSSASVLDWEVVDDFSSCFSTEKVQLKRS
jgi:hypothetical protein